MKAAVVHEWGQEPAYTDFPDPQPTGGAEVATVEASALTNLTRAVISGKHYSSKEITLPAIAGVDGVARLANGKRVYSGSLAPYGMMAERTVVYPAGAVEVPEHVDSVTAAAIPNPGISAWLALSHGAAVQPGQHVLVLGATGVTGSLAVQLAKSVFGAGQVTVAGRNAERLDWLRTVGADDAITLGSDDLTEAITARHATRPFDAVLDYLWGSPRRTDAQRTGGQSSVGALPRHPVCPDRCDERGINQRERFHLAQHRHHLVRCRNRQRAARGAAARPHRGPAETLRHDQQRRPAATDTGPAAGRYRNHLGGKGAVRGAGGGHSPVTCRSPVSGFPVCHSMARWYS